MFDFKVYVVFDTLVKLLVANSYKKIQLNNDNYKGFFKKRSFFMFLLHFVVNMLQKN